MPRAEHCQALATRMVHTLPAWGAWASNVRDFQTPYGSIGYRQASILWVLRHDLLADSDHSPTVLARYFGVQNSAITKAVDKLVEGEYLIRAAAENDRRRSELLITQKGVDISVFIEQLYTEPLQEILNDLTPEQCEALFAQLDVLERIVQRLLDVRVS